MGIQGRCDEGRQAVAILLSAFPRDCALEGGLRLPPVAIRGREQSPPVVASSGRDEDPGHVSLNTFITSSPRWLMTFTAMRPDLGLSKARDVSLCRVAQAASSISALSVHDEGYQVDRQPDGELRFRRPDGRVLPEVPRAPEGGHTASPDHGLACQGWWLRSRDAPFVRRNFRKRSSQSACRGFTGGRRPLSERLLLRGRQISARENVPWVRCSQCNLIGLTVAIIEGQRCKRRAIASSSLPRTSTTMSSARTSPRWRSRSRAAPDGAPTCPRTTSTSSAAKARSTKPPT